MPRLAPWARAWVAALAVAGPGVPAQPPADEGEAQTEWDCWYAGDTTFRCRVTRAPEEPPGVQADPPPEPPSSLLPRRGELPPIVRTIREHPGQLRGRTITIPLFSHPVDARWAATLVDSVMCGTRPACRVRIVESPGFAPEDPERRPR